MIKNSEGQVSMLDLDSQFLKMFAEHCQVVGGGDFREVLQSFFDINGCDITIPRPPHGKWLDSGAVVDRETGTSLCWRVYDLQFWGCPQRRRRVYLVCDFGSANAGELLFEQIPPVKDGLLGDIEQSIKAWKDFTNNAERST